HSLETHEWPEADGKKQVPKRWKCPGSVATSHSVTVPLVGEPGPKEKDSILLPQLLQGLPALALDPSSLLLEVHVPPSLLGMRGPLRNGFSKGGPQRSLLERSAQDPVTDICHVTAPASRSSLRPTKGTSLSMGFCPLPQPWEPGPSPPAPL
ncbi:vacuolar protein sorting-associated protein 72 homolog, partial [Sagmatias obliquidens]|uniref:vacuolar protein sorting-associated protein 72 homolog n=1 Tax=Sagmatias obliquidens TaxID=3371155 RepID=UPI000F43ECFC